MTAWTEHVKRVAKQQGITYGQAMKVASSSYKKQKGQGFFEDLGKGFVKGFTLGAVDIDDSTKDMKFLPFGEKGFLTEQGIKPSQLAALHPATASAAVPLALVGQGKRKRKQRGGALPSVKQVDKKLKDLYTLVGVKPSDLLSKSKNTNLKRLGALASLVGHGKRGRPRKM